MSLQKKTLEKAVKFISDLKLDEEEQTTIFNKIKDKILDLNDIEILKIIDDLDDISSDTPFNALFDLILKKLDIKQMNTILSLFLSDEELVDYLQDLLLEKII